MKIQNEKLEKENLLYKSANKNGAISPIKLQQFS